MKRLNKNKLKQIVREAMEIDNPEQEEQDVDIYLDALRECEKELGSIDNELLICSRKLLGDNFGEVDENGAKLDEAFEQICDAFYRIEDATDAVVKFYNKTGFDKHGQSYGPLKIEDVK